MLPFEHAVLRQATLLTLGMGLACGDDGAVPSQTESSSSTDAASTGPTSATTRGDSSTSTASGESESDTDPDSGESSSGSTDSSGSSGETTGSTTSVELCGNGVVEADEACDGDAFSDVTCVTEGFVAGELACTEACTIDTTACLVSVCGNETVEGKEECDGAFEESCLTFGFDDGALACDEACTFDTSQCVTFVCGNAILEGTESCDGVDLGGQTCASQGFLEGTLACDEGCTLDVSACIATTFCATPNLAIGPGIGSISSSLTVPPTLGFVTDLDVSVTATHTYVGDLELDVRASGFTTRLADNICPIVDDIDATFDQDALTVPDCVAPIAIEGNVLPFHDLDAFVGLPLAAGVQFDLTINDTANGDGGVLSEWCVSFTTTPADPVTCGDGVANYDEVCDGAAVHGQDPFTTCEDLGFVGGSLDCDLGTCGYDTSECSNTVIAACATPALAFGADDIESIVTIPDVGTVADLDLFVDLSHTWTEDVRLVLRHVASNTAVTVLEAECPNSDNVFVHWNDEASAPVSCLLSPPALATIRGNTLPQAPLSTFDGLPIAGEWRLEVDDTFAAEDDGTLNAWCIYITP